MIFSLLGVLAATAAFGDTAGTTITALPYGTLANGDTVMLYTLRSDAGLIVKITNYGGIITELHVPDRLGKTANIVLGKDSLAGYLKGHPYFGAIIGRYANRIAGARFVLDGTTYPLTPNNGAHTLHGGKKGFDKMLWKPEMIADNGRAVLKLTHTSPDGDQGFPGNLGVTVTYELTGDRLSIVYEAVTDKATHLNLTNHSYFNLAGQGTMLNHDLYINASRYTPVDDKLIPVGDPLKVSGTSFDFTRPTAVGTMMGNVPGGYDHNFVLDKKPGEEALAARLFDPKSGRVMEIFTTEPGLQFYAGGCVKNQGLCLETQHFPDSPNRPDFPGTVLRPGEKFVSRTSLKFGEQK
jgi:aldose 1-epimerase